MKYKNTKSLLLFAINVLAFSNCYHCYHISFPTFKKNLAVIKDININKLTDNDKNDLKILFNSVPMLLFKNQNIEPNVFYDFCKSFDDKSNDKVIHPFKYSQIDSVPQVSLRGEAHIKDMYGIKNVTLKYSEPFKNTLVWHQDIVGHGTELPPVVASIYMIKTPKTGGNTLFASMEDAYDSMEFYMKKKLSKYNVIYTNTRNDMMNSYFDYTGINRVLNNDFDYKGTTTLTRTPLIVYSNREKRRKALMLSPFRFNKFDKLTCDDSFDLYREIMTKYVFTPQNIVDIKWDKNDLLLFNNRKLIHTSTPTIEYKNQERLYYSCFVGTSQPIIKGISQ